MAICIASVKSTWPTRLNDEVQNLIESRSLALSEDSPWLLSDQQNALSLRHPSFKTSILLDLENDLHYNRKVSSTMKDPLLRALGYKKNHNLRVLDACGGFGRDAVFMTRQNIEVTSFERNPILYLLFLDALLRFPISNLTWKYGDSSSAIQNNHDKSAILYLDPMFTGEKKSALPQKEIQYFKELLKEDVDSEELLTLALKSKFDRIVVKRSDKGEFLCNVKPVNSWTGTSVRFDLYKPKGE